MERSNEGQHTNDTSMGEPLRGEDMSSVTFELYEQPVLSPDHQMRGGTVSIAAQEVGGEGATVTIGAQNEWEATLPLSAAKADLATDEQRNKIGGMALDQILSENPHNSQLGFSRLRDEVKRRTGLDSSAAALAVWAAEDRLEEF